MQIEGLIPFKSSTNQAITPLYFLRISSNVCSLCSIKLADIIIGLDFSTSRKARFKCSGNSFRIKPSEFVFTFENFSS